MTGCLFSPKQNSDNAESITATKSETYKFVPTKEQDDSLYRKLMISDAHAFNAQCPIRIDKETTLDNILAMPDQNILRYNYTLIEREKNNFKDAQQLKERMESSLINVVKTNPDMEIYRQHKTTLEYYYKDKNGQFLFSISVTPELYE